MKSQILRAAAEIELADTLAAGPRSTGELAALTDTHEPTLRRFLRALTALGVVVETESDTYELTELGGHLRKDAPDSVRNIVLFLCSKGPWAAWGEVMSSLRTGETSFDRIFGMRAFEYLGQHPDEAAVFNGAMSQHTRENGEAIISGYDFSGFGTLVDVGGGNGTFLSQVLRSAPDMQGVLFDLPSGAAAAEKVLADAGVAARSEVVTGSFFESDALPAGADAYVMKLVIHDWEHDKAVDVLRACRRAMAPDGRVLLVERVLPPTITADHSVVLLADLLMLVLTGGLERTEAEYGRLLAQADLEVVGVTGPMPPLGFSVLEAAPT